MISKSQAAALLDFVKNHSHESKSLGIYYVSNVSLHKLGIQQWDLPNTPFHKGHQHLEGAKDVVLHLIDKAALEEFAEVKAGFLQRIGFKGRDNQR